MDTADANILSSPHPERATRAIWVGRAARSREAASTDRGRASTLILLLTLPLPLALSTAPGHTTVPPGLRAFFGAAAQTAEHAHREDAGMDAAFEKIDGAIGDDVQEIEAGIGAGNASKYVGPALVPDGARGKAFTAKVKIVERVASEAANDARVAEPAPPVAVAGITRGADRSRVRAIAVAIGALVVVVGVGVWVVAKGPRAVGTTEAPAGSGVVSGAMAAPVMSGSGAAMVAAPTVSAPAAVGTAEVDAGAAVVPSGSAGAAAYKPKGGVVKGGDPYDAAVPLPAKTVEPVVVPPPSLTVIPSTPPPIGGDRVFGN